MAHVRVEGLSFSYPPAQEAPSAAIASPQAARVLSDVSFSVEEGEFCVLVGRTGCGKTTLLRSLKPELSPAGFYEGSIWIDGVATLEGGRPTGALSPRASAEAVGYVMQDPEAQVVCDSVWHELAFGLESVGMPQDAMRRRIAEVAHFLGIEPWARMPTETLSGGQKQLVCLAAALALRPRLLLLDEPTVQLDPNARKHFLFMLSRVNRELGITVVMATHSPEDVEHMATSWVRLGEGFRASSREHAQGALAPRRARRRAAEIRPAVSLDDVRFRYGRAQPWVLRGVDVSVGEGRVHAVVGGNGCGKSTLLNVMAGVLRAQRGTVDNRLAGSQALMPQDPKALFVRDTVAEELAEWRGRCGYGPADEAAMLERFGLAGHQSQHPYDLSGGQRQKLAFAKLLLCNPRLLLLDEPTKGLDPASCAEASSILRGLADEGRTVVFVTHDLEFAFVTADEVSMVFDGEIACTEAVEEFFEGNLVYRPADASRLYAEVRA